MEEDKKDQKGVTRTIYTEHSLRSELYPKSSSHTSLKMRMEMKEGLGIWKPSVTKCFLEGTQPKMSSSSAYSL